MFVPSPDGTKVLHNRIWGDRPNEPDLNVLSVDFMDGRHETRISPRNPNLTVVDLQFYDETSEAWPLATIPVTPGASASQRRCAR